LECQLYGGKTKTRQKRSYFPKWEAKYSRVPGYENCQIETAAWNLAGFLNCALEICWQRFGQFLNDFLNVFLMIVFMKILIFSMKVIIFSMRILDFRVENLDDFLYGFPNDS